MKTQLIVTIVLVVLVIISVLQAFQLNSLKTEIEEGNIKTSVKAASVQSGGSGSGASLPTNLDNLPGMVGGC